MAIHELATNAGKHGALSTAKGIVQVTWGFQGRSQSVFWMQWIEESGHPVREPDRHGFGYAIIVEMLKYSLNATVELAYPPAGVVWRFATSASDVLASDE